MQSLIFLSRVAFICNICFVLTWLIRYIPSLETGHVTATIVVLGLVVAFALNLLLNLAVITVLFLRKQQWHNFPQWLIITNFLFLIPQLILFLA